jgi:phospholipid/cholesterol/gamma-HCH transport system permease protein
MSVSDASRWYGDLGAHRQRGAQPRAAAGYLRLVEIEVMGVRSLDVALISAAFTRDGVRAPGAVSMGPVRGGSYVGPLVTMAIFRELGPCSAILVGAGRLGITAELGAMKVTEQIDARTLGVNYVKRLIVPRFLAALIVFPLLTALAGVFGVLGGMLTMFLERGTDLYEYWNVTTYWVVPSDFLTGIGKSVCFGALVTLIGCANGLRTEGGTEGLGRATTATVVQVAMGVIVSDFFLTKLLLIVFW